VGELQPGDGECRQEYNELEMSWLMLEARFRSRIASYLLYTLKCLYRIKQTFEAIELGFKSWLTRMMRLLHD
jgi:hypothetical protein